MEKKRITRTGGEKAVYGPMKEGWDGGIRRYSGCHGTLAHMHLITNEHTAHDGGL